MTTIASFSPAKVNLFLNLVGKRADNYHLLQSLMVLLNIGDVVIMQPAPELSCTLYTGCLEQLEDFIMQQSASFPSKIQACDSSLLKLLTSQPSVKLERTNNLVLHAAQALQKTLKISSGARIAIYKKIPFAAGLGGGSSNAATAVRMLLSLWQAQLELSQLIELLTPFGADIPFFLAGVRNAIVSGIGERVYPVKLDLSELQLLLVNPQLQIVTADVYKRVSPVSWSALVDQYNLTIIKRLSIYGDNEILRVFTRQA